MLQTALCYLEAVRSKVPELHRDSEKTRPMSECQEAPGPRIVPDNVFEIEGLDNPADSMNASDDQTAGSRLQTICIGDTVSVGDVNVDIPQPVQDNSRVQCSHWTGMSETSTSRSRRRSCRSA
ncbi:hypothetical protein LXA43DRAFT_997531 [Ganoderma leucocontextum]|nr:hypothetical protein LXA43DRAFT_997531 [Ganoderma leucocontextum]